MVSITILSETDEHIHIEKIEDLTRYLEELQRKISSEKKFKVISNPGLNDKYRRLIKKYELRYYNKDTDDTIYISPLSPTVFVTSDSEIHEGPFEQNRDHWMKNSINVLFLEACISQYERYGDRMGISEFPGESAGSNDFEIVFHNILYTIIPTECPPFIQETIRMLERRIVRAPTTEIEKSLQNAVDNLKEEWNCE